MGRYKKNETELLEDLEGDLALLGTIRVILELILTRVEHGALVQGPLLLPAIEEIGRLDFQVVTIQRRVSRRLECLMRESEERSV